MRTVWSPERYAALSPVDFMQQGEREVNSLEEIIAAAAPRCYDEFLGSVPQNRDVRRFLDDARPCAVVVFDGLSLREIPLLLRLAAKSMLDVVDQPGTSLAAVPSDTTEFIEQRLGMGAIGPCQLPSRRALSDAGIKAYYYDNHTRRHTLDISCPALLLWSAFPDNTYSDSGARFTQHFEQMHILLETAWMNTVQQIPHGRTILVTSDHGYVYFGPGMNFTRSNSEVRPLTEFFGAERFRRYSAQETPPTQPDLLKLPNRGVAVIRGRVQTHPPGAAGSKLYKHGGLSLMETLTPWIVLKSGPPH
ncbi:MAG: hypothetical protein ACP5MD_02800 [Verrucomicrobiia bacterium]